jgi:pterin-4a-carbinolamine dehydratase
MQVRAPRPVDHGQAGDIDGQRAASHHAVFGRMETRAKQALANVRVSGLRSLAQFREQPRRIFETVDHHPDVQIAYGEVTFELTRYDVGGKVTDRDVEVAKKISSAYRTRS